MPRSSQKVAMAVLMVACCASVAVAVVSEPDLGYDVETVLAEGNPTPSASESVKKLSQYAKKLTAQNPEIADRSGHEAAKALSRSAKIARKGNKDARAAEQDKAAKSLASVVKKEVADAIEQTKKMAKHTSKSVAATVTENTVTHKNKQRTIGDQDKLKLIKRDADVIEQAVLKRKKQAQNAEQAREDAAKQTRAVVNAKYVQAKQDLTTLRTARESYKGTHQKKAKAEQKLQVYEKDISHLKNDLATLKMRAKRIEERKQNDMHDAHHQMSSANNKLKGLLGKYKGSLKTLKTKLQSVKKAPDINQELAARITKSKAVVSQQESKIVDLNKDISKLAAALKSNKKHVEILIETKKRRANALRLAKATSDQLSARAVQLQTQVKQKTKKLKLGEVKHSNPSKVVKKTVDKIKTAVHKAISNAHKKVLQAAMKEAKSSAQAVAKRKATEAVKGPFKVPDLDQNLQEAGKMMQKLGLAPKSKPTAQSGQQKGGKQNKAKTVENSKKIASMIEEDTESMGDKLETHIDSALAKAGNTLKRLQIRTMTDAQMHKAELLAHVAHTLFEKAMQTGKSTDKIAAKVAMKKAISFRNTLV